MCTKNQGLLRIYKGKARKYDKAELLLLQFRFGKSVVY